MLNAICQMDTVPRKRQFNVILVREKSAKSGALIILHFWAGRIPWVAFTCMLRLFVKRLGPWNRNTLHMVY